MQRFDINEGFPNPSPRGIKPYISSSFVLIDENGNLISLEKNWFGNADGLSRRIAQSLKIVQDGGFKIIGDIHPFYKKPINIEGDIEIYRPFPAGSAEHNLLLEQGVNLIYEGYV